MAARAGVPQSTVARIETYQVQPSLLTLSKLLAAIGLEPRVHIEEYDDHDDGLDTQSAAMTPQQRAAREIAQDAFSVALRAGRPVK